MADDIIWQRDISFDESLVNNKKYNFPLFICLVNLKMSLGHSSTIEKIISLCVVLCVISLCVRFNFK